MTIEVVAKKVEDAIKQGLQQLDATLDEVKVEVIESGGLFRKAKVKLTLEREEESVKAEPEEKHAEAKTDKSEKPVKADPVKTEKSEKPAQPAQPAKTEKPVKADKKDKAAEKSEPVKADKTDKPNKAEKAEKVEKTEKPAPAVKKEKKPAKPENTEKASEKAATDDVQKKERRPEDDVAAAHAVEFIKKTVELMGFDGAEVKGEGDKIIVDAPEGDDSIIIGRHGETLSALSYLAETCARAEKSHIGIVVDCNGYRDRRAASLSAMARRRAHESAAKHRKIKLEPMDRTDRRTIHCALADDAYVTTSSEGKEPYRCVVIIPKDGVVDDKNRDNRDRGRHDRRDRDRKGNAASGGRKPVFDSKIHGFVGHNDAAETPETADTAAEPAPVDNSQDSAE